jgi:hypothetical protein
MKKFPFALLAAAALPLLSGCVQRRVYVQSPPPATVIVDEAPPSPQAEVYIAAPGPGYFWVPGYWSWQGRWVWIGGRWTLRPHPGAAWVSGHWAHHGRGYIWIEGRWR